MIIYNSRNLATVNPIAKGYTLPPKNRIKIILNNLLADGFIGKVSNFNQLFYAPVNLIFRNSGAKPHHQILPNGKSIILSVIILNKSFDCDPQFAIGKAKWPTKGTIETTYKPGNFVCTLTDNLRINITKRIYKSIQCTADRSLPRIIVTNNNSNSIKLQYCVFDFAYILNCKFHIYQALTVYNIDIEYFVIIPNKNSAINGV